jgi:hypothetical protein
MTRLFSLLAFLLGASVVVWTGSSFISSNLLALIVTVVIGLVYAIGLLELLSFQSATRSLNQALNSIDAQAEGKVDNLKLWLNSIHHSLHNSVSLRIEGHHQGLPAPVLTPYLVGLLVMLGLLGTFVGMVDTLKGAVLALEGTTELEAIRAGLAAPIKGLSMAFGTSVAGVAASAMLGLISTLSRRERMMTSRLLDSQINHAFQDFSLSYNRQQTFKALQQQASALPDVAEQLNKLTVQLGNMSEQLSHTLTNSQSEFHGQTQQAYTELAQAVETSLKTSLSESARLAGESIQPAINALVNEVQQQTLTNYQHLRDTSEQHLQHLNSDFSHTAEQVSTAWQTGLAAQEQQNRRLTADINSSVQSLNTHTRETLDHLLTELQQRSQAWSQQQQESERERLLALSEQQQLWATRLEQNQQLAAEQLHSQAENYQGELSQLGLAQQDKLKQLGEQQANMATQIGQQWKNSAEQHQTHLQGLCDALQRCAGDITKSNSETSIELINKISELLNTTENLVQSRVDTEQQWLADYHGRIDALSSDLNDKLNQLHEAEAERGNKAVDRLAELQEAVTQHLGQLGNALEAPMSRLIATASETPKAAAEVIEKLRAEITKNIERDNSLLDERRRIMEELNTLSATLEQSSSGQRLAIEKMVDSSASMLSDVGQRFNQQLESEVGKLSDMVDYFSGSAAELGSLGEAFSLAVSLFNDGNNKLLDSLKHIDASLQNATSRSDEQLAYYVAQAREVIDHNVLSQQELIAQIRHLSQKSPLLSNEAG